MFSWIIATGLLLAQDMAEMRYLRPTDFPDLPPAISQDLKRLGCRIPQSAIIKKPHNVISGHFAAKDQTDWAVLCSIGGYSTILIYWNNGATRPAHLARFMDLNYIQNLGPGLNGYSRALGIANRQFILSHYRYFGGPKPPPIHHEGIDDMFLEKASVVHYFYKGRWRVLTGSD